MHDEVVNTILVPRNLDDWPEEPLLLVVENDLSPITESRSETILRHSTDCPIRNVAQISDRTYLQPFEYNYAATEPCVAAQVRDVGEKLGLC